MRLQTKSERAIMGIYRQCSTRFILISLFLLLAGCATTVGPRIASEEERRAELTLLALSEAWQKRQEQKIDELGARLMKAARNESPLKFRFVAKPEQTGGKIHPDSVNAWTDGESVWVTRGMIRFLKNEDEVGIVLAHEMSHAYRGHMAYLRAKQILGLALGIPATVFGGQAGGQLVMLLLDAATKKFDRDQEREADLYGLVWAYKAGFDVDVAKDVFKRMAIEMPESVKQGFLSSHPGSAERFLTMEQIAKTLKAGLDPLKAFEGKEEQEADSKKSGSSAVKPIETSLMVPPLEVVEGDSPVEVPEDIRKVFAERLNQLLPGRELFKRGLKIKYRFVLYDPGNRFLRWLWGGIGGIGMGLITVEAMYLDGADQELATIKAEGMVGDSFSGTVSAAREISFVSPGSIDVAIQRAAEKIVEYARQNFKVYADR